MRTKATWEKFELLGHTEAYVATVDGRKVGTIVKVGRKSAWNVYLGTGLHSKNLGNYYSKEGAKFVLLTAEEGKNV